MLHAPDNLLTDAVRERLVAYARRVMSGPVRQKHDPESVVQSVLLSAVQARNADLWALPADDLIPRLLAKTWHHVRRRAGRLRALKRDPARECPLPEDGPAAAGGPDAVAAAEMVGLICALAAALGPDYVTIVTRIAQGVCRRDIALELSVSPDTVTRRLADLRERLRERLGPGPG